MRRPALAGVLWTLLMLLRAQGCAPRPLRSALPLPALHQLADLVELHAAVDRSDVGVLVHGIANAERRETLSEASGHLAQDRFLHEQARARAAALACCAAIASSNSPWTERGQGQDPAMSFIASSER